MKTENPVAEMWDKILDNAKRINALEGDLADLVAPHKPAGTFDGQAIAVLDLLLQLRFDQPDEGRALISMLRQCGFEVARQTEETHDVD